MLKTGNNIIRNILFVSAVLFLGSCKYSATETNVQTINMPEGNINLVVLDTNAISVIRGEVTFAIETILGGHELKGIEGYLDDNRMSLDITRPGFIKFRSDYYPDGNYKLHLVMYTSTNSGSLAERGGAEYFYIIKDYNVTLFNGPIYTPSITEFKIVNGALSINWEKYSQPGFKKYVLKKNRSVIATITSADQTNFEDSTYIGEDAEYELSTTVFTYTLTNRGRSCAISPASIVSAEKITGDKVKLTWNRCLFSHAFEKYTLYYGIRDSIVFQSINDTTWIDSLPLIGSNGPWYKLVVQGKNGMLPANIISFQGPPCGNLLNPNNVHVTLFDPKRNIYIGNSYDDGSTIYEIDGNSLNLINQIKVSPYAGAQYQEGISSDGAYLFTLGSTPDSRQIVNKLNIGTYTIQESYDFSRLIHHPDWQISILRISKANTIAALFRDYKWALHLYIFDIETKTVLANLDLPYGGLDYENLQLSSDGKYILISNYLYRYQSNSLVKISSDAKGILSRDDSTLFKITPTSIQQYYCSNLQKFKEIPIPKTPQGYFPKIELYDQFKDLVGFYTAEGMTVLNLNTGKYEFIRNSSGCYTMLNGIIFIYQSYYKRITSL